MPLRCLNNHEGKSLLAFDLTPTQWDQLRADNLKEKHLSMPCCNAGVVLKTSKLGTRFFAHKRIGDCTLTGETEHHLKLKTIAVEVARSFCWNAETEVSGKTPGGEEWIADVLATKGDAKIAIEIQWSPQTLDETLRRQRRYADSGVRCLWLMRQNLRDGFWGTEELPLAKVGESNAGEDYMAHLEFSHNQAQCFDVRQFLQAAFSGRFHYQVPEACLGTASVWVGPIRCWRCKKDTNIVTFVYVDLLGTEPSALSISDLGGHPSIVRKVVEHIPEHLNVGEIKPRFSKTEGGSYLSNGCGHCDALIGRFFEHDAWYLDSEVGRFPVRVDEDWLPLVQGREGWAVYSFDADGPAEWHGVTETGPDTQ